jgi:excisionase family DNA binding protein
MTLMTYLTKKEAALQLGVSVRTVNRHIAAGRLTRHGSDQLVLVDSDELKSCPTCGHGLVKEADHGG